MAETEAKTQLHKLQMLVAARDATGIRVTT